MGALRQESGALWQEAGALRQEVEAGYHLEAPCLINYKLVFKSRRFHSVPQVAPPGEDQMFKHIGTFHIQTLQPTGPHCGLVRWVQWPEAYKRKALGFAPSFKGKLSSPAGDE